MDRFEIAEDITTYDGEALSERITAGQAELDRLFAIEDPTAEDVAEAERVTAAVKALTSERDTRATAAAERSERMAALRAETVEASEDDEPEDEPEDEPDDPEVEAAAETEDEPEQPVVKASAKSPRKRLATKTKRPDVPDTPVKQKLVITAAADNLTFATGAEMSGLDALTEAVNARVRSFNRPVGDGRGIMQQYPVAQIHLPTDFKAKDTWAQDEMDKVADETRLPGGSLTAAGQYGWCAPSETLYDLCAPETTDGLVDLPTMEWSRGGISYTDGPDFSTLYSSTGFTQTETQAEAGTSKGCYTVDCVPFSEERLDATGLCIKVPLLTNAAYPELTANVISRSIIAQQHRVSASLITRMVAKAGTALVATDMGGSYLSTLNAVELIAQQVREKYRMQMNATLEGVAPHWVTGLIRADIAAKTGQDVKAVTDQQIQAEFTTRGIRLQFVYNWQSLTQNAVVYPETFQLLLYPAGTFVRGTNSVISLNAVYDAASLDKNLYTGLFTEEGIGLAQRCFQSKLVTIASCAAGITGAASNTVCMAATS